MKQTMTFPLRYIIRTAQELSDILFNLKKLPFVDIERVTIDRSLETPYAITLWTRGQIEQ